MSPLSSGLEIRHGKPEKQSPRTIMHFLAAWRWRGTHERPSAASQKGGDRSPILREAELDQQEWAWKLSWLLVSQWGRNTATLSLVSTYRRVSLWNFKAAKFLPCGSRRLIPSPFAVMIVVHPVKKKLEYPCIIGEPKLGCGVWDIPFQIK